jgi:ribosomal protein S18 acetylase RimI-like enzyme
VNAKHIVIRDAKETDLVYLHDCDLKCFHDTWDHELWRLAGSSFGIKVATRKNAVVGFAVYERDDNDPKEVCILKLGVKPKFRRFGIGTQLINSIIEFAQLIEANFISLLTPENMIDPGGSMDASAWMSKVGFRATVPLHPGAFPYYGQRQAGVLWHLVLSRSEKSIVANLNNLETHLPHLIDPTAYEDA